MGGTGKGQEDSIVIAYMEKAFDIKIKYIPYKGGGDVAKDLAGQQIMATVNNPAETKGFYANGDVVPLLSFSDERMPAFPDVPTVKEMGHDFSYYNQRAVVGAPGMSAEAAEYYQNLFKTIYETEEWQGYMESESLSPLWMNPGRAEGLLAGSDREPQGTARRYGRVKPTAVFNLDLGRSECDVENSLRQVFWPSYPST